MFIPDPWGNDSQFDEHIFQMGWFNHQLDRNTGVSLFSHLIWVFFRTSKLHLEVRGLLFWSCPRGDPEGSYRWLYWRWCLCLKSKSFEAADRSWQIHGFPPRLMRKWRKWLWALDWLDLIGRFFEIWESVSRSRWAFSSLLSRLLECFLQNAKSVNTNFRWMIWMPLDIIGQLTFID